jgi:hypothetical protein
MSDTDEPARIRRAHALATGAICDLSASAGELGFNLPVACSRCVYLRYLIPNADLRGCGQTLAGRTQDLLRSLQLAIQRGQASQANAVQIEFRVEFLMATAQRRVVRFIAVFGPDDAGDWAITIVRPQEV